MSPNLRRISALGLISLASAAISLGQSLTATPSSLSYNYSPGTNQPITQTITVNSATPTAYTVQFSPGTLGSYFSYSPLSPSSGEELQVTLLYPTFFTAPTSGNMILTPAGAGGQPLTVPLNINPGTSGGTGTYTPSPSTVAFNFPFGTTTPQSLSMFITGPAGATLFPTVSTNLAAYVQVPSSVQTNSSFLVSLNSPQLFGTAQTGTITFTPAGTGGVAFTVPITINPGGTGGGSGLTPSPSSVTFSFTPGTTTPITQYMTVSGPVGLTLTPTFSTNLQGLVTTSSGNVTTNSQFGVVLTYPYWFTAPTTGTMTLTPPAGSGYAAIQVPIYINTSSTGSNITATPSTVTFNYATGTTSPVSQLVQITAPSTVALTPSLSNNLIGFVSVPATISSNGQFTMTLQNPQLFTQYTSGSLTLTPPIGSGLTAINVPVVINPGGTGTGGITVTPTALSYIFTSGTTSPISQTLQITAPVTAAVTPTFSTNLAPYFQVPSSITTNSQIFVTLTAPQFLAAGATGTLTLTPAAGSGLGTVTIPINVNTSGTGTGTVVATPNSLTFNTPVGTTPTAQNVTLTSADFTQQSVFASASSASGFLSVSQSSFVTPSTLIVRVNESVVGTPGTYTGTISVTNPQTGLTSATIPVTLNVQTAVTVTPSPASVTLSGSAGSTTPAQTTVQLTSTDNTIPFTATANVASGTTTWLSVTPTSGNLGSSLTISANATGLSTGTYTGSVTVTAQGSTVATIPVTFTVTEAAALQLSPASLTFTHQTTSASAPASQTIQISSSSTAAAMNWTATATSTGNWLQVTPANGTTPGTLTVSVTPTGLQPGTYTGQISVSSPNANNSPQTATVTLTVSTPAQPVISSVVNAASFAPTVAVPGEIVTLRGTDLGPATGVSGTVDGQGMLSTTVGGVRVLFDGVAAPILYASATQINAVVPFELSNRVSTRVQLQYQGQTSRELELRVGDTAPGLFTSAGNGTGQGAILNQNGTINSATNAEARGNVVVLYATGGGQTSPASTTGQVSSGAARFPVAPVTVRIGGVQATVLYAGSAPGLISGALQLNVVIPQSVGTGSLPIEVQIGGATSQAGVTVAVR